MELLKNSQSSISENEEKLLKVLIKNLDFVSKTFLKINFPEYPRNK